MMTTIACCQVKLSIDDLGSSHKAVLNSVRNACEAGAELIVVPELANSGYCFTDRFEAEGLAEDIQGSFIKKLAVVAQEHEVVIITGFNEKNAGKIYSSSVIIDCGEVVGVYRKTHLWNTEKDIFDVGNLPPLVVDTSVGKVATAVCYDIEFSEVVRLAAHQGAYLIAVPVNWPFNEKPKGLVWPIEIHKAMAHASEHRISIAIADRVGGERHTNWEGGSVIVSEDGWPISSPELGLTLGRETIVCAQVNPEPGRWLNRQNHVVYDRREDIYSVY